MAEAMRWLTRGADLGSDEARRELGLILLRGEGVEKDPDHAATLFRKAADAGDAQAEAALGVMYAYGDGVPQDWALAVAWSRKAADQDNPWAQANYGLFLETARAGAADAGQAAAWYRRAADHGFALAQVRLGLLYQNGNGVRQDPRRAFDLYLQAARDNDPIGERLLALAFRDGVGTPRNEAESVAWLKRSADHGDAEAMYLLSETYASAQGAARDPQASRRYLRDAAEQGHSLAAARLGNEYAEGQDHQQAARWLRIANERAAKEAAFLAEDPHTYRGRQLALARYHLGVLLMDGDGVEQDVAQAVRLLRAASERDRALATNQLARMSHQGVESARTTQLRSRCIEAAAAAGVGSAAFELAEGYVSGWAGEQSDAVALSWYRRRPRWVPGRLARPGRFHEEGPVLRGTMMKR